MKRVLPLPTLLAAALALLAFGFLAHDVLAPAASIALPPDDGGAAAPAFVVPVAAVPAAAVYTDMAARPLFFPTRRPPPPPAEAGAPAAPPLDFSLVGVVTGPGQTMALVQQPGQAQAVVVHVGSVVDGWTVTKISRSGIEVAAAGTSRPLRIVQ